MSHDSFGVGVRKKGRLPDPLRHRSSMNGIVAIWKNVQKTAVDPETLKGLPRFVAEIGRAIVQCDVSTAIDALQKGDPAFFVAVQIRLDQLDCALVKAGRGLPHRAQIIRAKWYVEGFRVAAEQNLREMGGEWPPSPLQVIEGGEGKPVSSST